MAKSLINTNGRVQTRTQAQVRSIISYDNALSSKYATQHWYNKARRMRRDPTIALVRRLVIAPVLIAKWSVESKDDAPADSVEWIEEQMMPQRRHLLSTGMAGCLDFGWQPYEVIIDPLSGDLTKVKQLLQDFSEILVWKDTGAFAGIRQYEQIIGGAGVRIDAGVGRETGVAINLNVEETLLYNFDVEGTDWYGQAVMANVEDPYDRSLENNKATERYVNKVAGSHWVVTYPVGRTLYNGTETDNLEIALDLLARLEASGSIILPAVQGAMKDMEGAWEVDIKEGTSATHDTLLDRASYLDTLKVRGFGVPERSILEGEFGTKAEAGEHGNFAIAMMEQRHQDLLDITNWHLVNRLIINKYGEQFANTVWLAATPLSDDGKLLLKEIYKTILGDATLLQEEYEQFDREAIRMRLDLPIDPNAVEQDFEERARLEEEREEQERIERQRVIDDAREFANT